MDNLCHTLVGAALAQSGLKKRSPLGTATLLIAANLPDVDVVSLAWGSTAGLAFRRGWTHGVLALSLWPFLLAAVMVGFDRAGKRRGARVWPLVGLSAIGVLSHTLLDLLNTYGVRWLMPFSARWYYGDTLFIVDIWMWLVLGAGVVVSLRREQRERPDWSLPAGAALGAATLYTLGMLVVGRLAASQVRFELNAEGVAARRVLASPIPVTPVLRDVVVDEGDRYLVGRIRVGGSFVAESHWPKRDPFSDEEDPDVSVAASTPAAATFLRWARYPTYIVDRRGNTTVVHFIDLRYARSPEDSFGTLSVPVSTAQLALSSLP
jgi:inner membrane protein